MISQIDKEPDPSLTPISERAYGRWPEIFSALAPDLSEALAHYGKHVPCPVHGGEDGFRLFDEGERAIHGEGICNTCGRQQNGFVLLSWLYDWSATESIRRVSEVLSGLPARSGKELANVVAKAREKDRIKAEKAKISARRWWQESLSITSPDAWPLHRYMNERGLVWADIFEMFSDDFRFHPSLPYFEKGIEVDHFPALLSLGRNVDGQVVFMHRTWIAKNGHGKAPVSAPRKTTSFFRKNDGAAIRIPPTFGSQVDVAEGIETALSVMLATGNTTWSVVNTALMEQWVPPDGVKFVNIWSDKDRKLGGQKAAQKLAESLREMGIMVSIMEPGCPIGQKAKSVDWNDALLTYGPESFSPVYCWEAARWAS